MDTFKLTHHNLLKLKKYEGLVYNDDHAIAEINYITDTLTSINMGNKSKTPDKDLQNKTKKVTSSVETVGNIVSLATQQKNVKTTQRLQIKINGCHT